MMARWITPAGSPAWAGLAGLRTARTRQATGVFCRTRKFCRLLTQVLDVLQAQARQHFRRLTDCPARKQSGASNRDEPWSAPWSGLDKAPRANWNGQFPARYHASSITGTATVLVAAFEYGKTCFAFAWAARSLGRRRQTPRPLHDGPFSMICVAFSRPLCRILFATHHTRLP